MHNLLEIAKIRRLERESKRLRSLVDNLEKSLTKLEERLDQ